MRVLIAIQIQASVLIFLVIVDGSTVSVIRGAISHPGGAPA
jgi:hypothetical protein